MFSLFADNIGNALERLKPEVSYDGFLCQNFFATIVIIHAHVHIF